MLRMRVFICQGRAQAEGKNFAQMANVSVVTVLKNGVALPEV